MRLLVCGGRDYKNEAKIHEVLAYLLDTYKVSHIISGGANGVDTIAVQWAEANKIPFTVYEADWKKYNKAAGPIRNTQMLVEGKPDFVVAFPGGAGTANMVKQSKDKGIKVILI